MADFERKSAIRVHVTAIGRTNVGINKAEYAGRKDAQIGFADALQRVPSDDGGQLSRISWLDSPGYPVQRNVGSSFIEAMPGRTNCR